MTQSPARSIIDSLAFVSIPSGVVRMGTPTEEIDAVVQAHADLELPRRFFAKEAPRHDVLMGAFDIALVPITISQWRTYARATGARERSGADDLPVDGLLWSEATAFCEWLGDPGQGEFGLPTEEQWERSARGSDEREFPWGDTFDVACANLAERGIGQATPVGSFPRGASSFGVLDLAGNVDEWTASLYAPYPGAPDDVPLVESWVLDPHVTRGGGWMHHRDLARCARRHGVYPGGTGAGFRVVRRSTRP